MVPLTIYYLVTGLNVHDMQDTLVQSQVHYPMVSVEFGKDSEGSSA